MLLTAALTIQAVTAAPAPALKLLEGCWSAPGQVRGKPVRTVVRGSLRLGGRYLLLELHRVDGAADYDAAVVMGLSERGRITAYWMDTFGPAFSIEGTGTVAPDGGMEVVYRYPDAEYVNRFSRTAAGWRWSIDERRGKKTNAFAYYMLSRSECGNAAFGFDMPSPK